MRALYMVVCFLYLGMRLSRRSPSIRCNPISHGVHSARYGINGHVTKCINSCLRPEHSVAGISGTVEPVRVPQSKQPTYWSGPFWTGTKLTIRFLWHDFLPIDRFWIGAEADWMSAFFVLAKISPRILGFWWQVFSYGENKSASFGFLGILVRWKIRLVRYRFTISYSLSKI